MTGIWSPRRPRKAGMADARKPEDPFAGLSGVMTDQKLFESHRLPSQQEKFEERVTQELTQKDTQTSAQKVTRNPTQVSKKVSNVLNKRSHDLPAADEVEDLAYRLRKENKVRVNADVPAEWKERLDDLAHKLRVGKYELMLYVI